MHLYSALSFNLDSLTNSWRKSSRNYKTLTKCEYIKLNAVAV